MRKKQKQPATSRRYPDVYEKIVPIALGIIVVAIIVVLVVIVAVALGLFP